MSASVIVSETNGPSASPVVTDAILNLNFGSADLPSLDPDLHPITLNLLAPTYACTKWIRLKVSALNGISTVSNIRFWKSSGDYLTGETIHSNIAAASTYPGWSGLAYAHGVAGLGPVVTPYYASGQAIYGGSTTSAVAVQETQPESANVTISGSLSTPLSAPGYSDYVILTHGVNAAAGTPAGPVNPKTFTFLWDEA